MGNTPSSNKKEKGDRAASVDGLPLEREQYRSFDRSDTKESSRSFRNSIRSKIPGSNKNDSPRNSSADLSNPGGVLEKSDSASTKSRSRRGSTASAQLSPVESDAPDDSRPESPKPPPSPVHGALGSNHNQVDKAQRTGEVDHVSDAPPTGMPPQSKSKEPMEPILQKKGQPIPRAPEVPSPIDGSGSPMETSALKLSDLDDMIQRLLDTAYTGKVTKTVCLKNAEIFAICSAARELFLNQPSLLELAPPVKVVGDIHGQFTDLIRMFEMCGFPPDANYLFLGDYVDRGKQSLETILLLLCYKLKFPENFFLLRGNHECANVTRVYGFYDECKRRCNIKVWKAFVDTFNCLPIAAIVAQKIFCVHGGLSPSLSHMDDIRQIARPTDVPDYGLLNDLLWSDPADMENDWESNERGVSYCFGKKVIMEFLQRHDFDLVCRAHMVVEDGYEFFSDRVLVTVFSAPNYCGEFDNWGAVMAVSGELLCSFELLKPLDSSALKSHIKKSRNQRKTILNSPVQIQEGEEMVSRSLAQNSDFFNQADNYTLANESDGNNIRHRLDSVVPIPVAALIKLRTAALDNHRLSVPPFRTASSARRLSSASSEQQDSALEAHDAVAWRRERDQNRALWASTLPQPIFNRPGRIETGYNYDYINQGASSKKSPEDLRIKPKKGSILTAPFR